MGKKQTLYSIQYKEFIIQYTLSKYNIHIVNSYQVRTKEDMETIVKSIRTEAAQNGFEYSRSNSSWVKEWMAHNYMYDKGFQKDRTGSVDLNEDESKLRLLAYKVISLCYKE